MIFITELSSRQVNTSQTSIFILLTFIAGISINESQPVAVADTQFLSLLDILQGLVNNELPFYVLGPAYILVETRVVEQRAKTKHYSLCIQWSMFLVISRILTPIWPVASTRQLEDFVNERDDDDILSIIIQICLAHVHLVFLWI